MSLLTPKPSSPFVFTNDYYWTSTTVVGTPANGWAVYVTSSAMPASVAKGNNEVAWCVRGGHGHDGQ